MVSSVATTCDCRTRSAIRRYRSEEHTSELQSRSDLVCRLLLEKKKKYAHHDQPLAKLVAPRRPARSTSGNPLCERLVLWPYKYELIKSLLACECEIRCGEFAPA